MAKRPKFKPRAGMVLFKEKISEFRNRSISIRVENPLRRTQGCILPTRFEPILNKFNIKTIHSPQSIYDPHYGVHLPAIIAIGCVVENHFEESLFNAVQISDEVKEYMLTWDNEDFLSSLMEEVTIQPFVQGYERFAGVVDVEEPEGAFIVSDIGDEEHALFMENRRYFINPYARHLIIQDTGEWMAYFIDQMNATIDEQRRQTENRQDQAAG